MKRDKTGLKDRNIIARGVAPGIKKGSGPSPEGAKEVTLYGEFVTDNEVSNTCDADTRLEKTYPQKITHLKPFPTGHFSHFLFKFCEYLYFKDSIPHIKLHSIQENFLYAL
ncbi:hypothetical protein [Flavipsychrobacter stenotrophus]|uniref:hypothetical protein n=1 Tax=Flavipsychrobacter stenotrophus TaxID=2077091 RepID=UPI00105717C5|nr:hypothetical protein [Flavipsychrobacter stenotrophus]